MLEVESKEGTLNMICPDCLEEYQFVEFDVDSATLEHRGVFKCSCPEPLMFPEFMTRHMVADEDLKEQLRRSRLFHLQCSVKAEESSGARLWRGVMQLHARSLVRYLEDFSEKSARLLK